MSLDGARQSMYTSCGRWAGAVMSLRKPLVELPAAIEADQHPRMATNESRHTLGDSADLIPGCRKKNSLFDVRSRNVCENKQVDKVKWQTPGIPVEFIRILRTFPAMCGQLRPSGRSVESIEFKLFLGELKALAVGRERVGSTRFRAGGHDMYEKAGTYLKNAKLTEGVWYS
jgi:hypothetical protein